MATAPDARIVREVVWLTEDDEGNCGIWYDPDNARRQIAQDRAAEIPGVYEWVNDPDRTHELLLRDEEPIGLTLRMMLVADAPAEQAAGDGEAPRAPKRRR